MRCILRLQATAILFFLAAAAIALEPCRVDVVDAESGWPVPLVELRTTHNVRLVSDNAGVIALDLPECMDRKIWFTVEGHGYSVPANGFGQRGVQLMPTPGGRLTVEVHRQLPAKRLGRLTGGGIFAESQRFGEYSDWQESGVFGCDSVQNAIYGDRLFWAWGDTTLPGRALGLFHMSGATTDPKPLDSFKPPLKLRYRYFRGENDRPRSIGKMPGGGPSWLGGFASLPDRNGEQRLVATFTKINAPLTPYQTGLCVWNDQSQQFEPLKVLWTKSDDQPKPPPMPDGHPVRWTDDDGREWLLFGQTFPDLRCQPTFEAWSNPDAWEALQPQTEVATVDGKSITPLRSSIAFNDYRQKWVAVFMQKFGQPSAFGELWYAEADQPTGPWGPAVKVVTHNNYTFYNPKLHPEFTPAGSPILLFEGTYTRTFADHPPATPRYDYNQVLYRLDLDEMNF